MINASEVPVVYRDEQLLVLDKPVGLATTAPDGGPCLFALAHEIDPDAPQLHPLSRLDTQVTGLVTFARTEQANRWAMEARRRGELWRRYLGITTRRPEPERGEYRFSIGIDPRDPKKRTAHRPGAKSPYLKEACTRYRVHAEAGPLCAVDFYPQTGRTHQLRVHASAAGCPLAGDVAYGGAKRLTLPNGRILTAGRVMLHCAYFRMLKPGRGGTPGELLELQLAPPADMQQLWRSAGGEPLDLNAVRSPET
ncbi:MAG: RNA pseudouridine synthase [Myxococcales bacterium]